MDLLGNIKVDFDLKARFAKSVSLPLRAIKKPRKAPGETKQAERAQSPVRSPTASISPSRRKRRMVPLWAFKG